MVHAIIYYNHEIPQTMHMIEIPSQSRTQLERLYFIEFTILFLGKLQRNDLIEQFGISKAAATKDLSLYSKLNPKILIYDFRLKYYQYSNAETKFSHNVDRALFAIAGDRNITQSESVELSSEKLPSYVGASIKREVDVRIAAALTRSMHQQRTVRAVYRSISGGERERLLTPLALIHDGLRWHIRCFDQDKMDYRDYNLARFLTVIDQAVGIGNLESDTGWSKWVELEIAAHPNSEHPETIQLDYGINDRYRRIRLRSCLVGYFLRFWPIDYSEQATEDPRNFHLRLLNKQQLMREGVSEWAFK